MNTWLDSITADLDQMDAFQVGLWAGFPAGLLCLAVSYYRLLERGKTRGVSTPSEALGAVVYLAAVTCILVALVAGPLYDQVGLWAFAIGAVAGLALTVMADRLIYRIRTPRT